jgi:2-aminoadipate transaminase
VLREQGAAALQYATTEGFAPLRQFIADRYLSRHGMTVNPDNILITSGSQQALDLLGKVLVNEGRISSSKSRATLAPSRRSPSINRISSR